MPRKTPTNSTPKRKPKISEAERHKRFVDMAREIEADETPEAFEQAFDSVIGAPPAVPTKSRKSP